MKKWQKKFDGQWDECIPIESIRNGVTPLTVDFAERFGRHLAKNGKHKEKQKRFNKFSHRDEEVEIDVAEEKLTTTQLRKFFGELKKQQMTGYIESHFILLKPKLAYAVGRVKDGKKYYKIEDLYNVLTYAIDVVVEEDELNKKIAFKNFIEIFEAIVAYHKAAENQ